MTHYRRDIFRLLEAAAVGVFFVQAVRFLFMALYVHISSASLVSLTTNPGSILGLPGVVNPPDVQIEVVAAGIAIFIPLLSVILGRLWFGPALAAIAVAAGRVFMSSDTGQIGVIGAAVAAGAGLLYIATITMRRPNLAPICLVIGFAADQLIRLYGGTIDPTWNISFLDRQTALSIGLFIVAVLTAFFDNAAAKSETNPEPPGEINGWSAFALAGLLYLEFVILGLPNTLAHRAGVDYIQAAPWLVAVTLLPLVPEVRDFARRFMGMFDGPYRGWVWFLLNALLVVLGLRLDGIAGMVALIAAQLMISLAWWWLVQPSDGRGRLFTGPGVIFGTLVFLVLAGADFFTYEYAFVRGVQPPFDTLLRSMRGLGLPLAVFAVLLTGLPAILARKRLPWRGGRTAESLAGLAVVVGAGVLAYSLATPIIVAPPIPPSPGQAQTLRIATLNLHGGYSLYFGSDLDSIALELRKSGADIILLQEVESGRLISGGIDQPAWLAHALNMQLDYYPTNESLQGLAVLTRLPILATSGTLLTSIGRQTGVQLVRVAAADGTPIDIYNTQLGLFLLNSQDQDQDRQIQEVLAFVGQNDANGHLVIGGTFNSLPGTDNLIYAYMIQRGFIDPLSDARVERSYTLKIVNGDLRRVDYLWTKNIQPCPTQPVCVQLGDTSPIDYSSHNMVIIQISVGGPVS